MNNKIYFETLGCFKNIEDSERAAGILADNNYIIVDSPEDADVIVINTCAFIEDAKRESIDKILELGEYHDYGKKIIVSGCLAQRYANDISEELVEVDAFVGVNDYNNLPDVISKVITSDKKEETFQSHSNSSIISISEDVGILTGSRKALSARATSFLKVSEGCSNRCTYCSIPAIRGPYRSIPKDLIINDAKSLIQEGAKELVLIAQDVSAYGIDFNDDSSLPNLLNDLSKLEQIVWLRLMYCYEDRITSELIDIIAYNPKICRYIDIPLQHISNSVLKRMNRHSTTESIKRTLDNLRNRVPEIAIRTTLLTGFPGETESDFDELYDFVEEQKFERLGVFAYSREDGTPAFDMPDQIPTEIAEERRDAIMQLQMDISLMNNSKLVDKTINVIVEEKEDDNVYIGRSEFDAPEIDNSVIIKSEKSLVIGDFVNVKITDAMDYDIIGEVE